MKRTPVKILYVGRHGDLSRRLSGVFESAGYAVSPGGRSRQALEKLDLASFDAVVSDGLTPAQLRTLHTDGKSDRNGRSTRVGSAPFMFTAELRRDGMGPSSTAVPMTLRALRASVGKIQGDVARKMAMTQPQLSRVEARRDHLISTVRKYVRALGGDIEVIAVIDGARVALQDV
jgi:hypothetical protein